MTQDADSARQADHYDRILSDYERHYYDRHSLAYRREFILEPMLRGVDLSNKKVADLASGSGETSRFLASMFPGIELTGYDISPAACAEYTRKTGRPAHVLDLTKGYEGGEQYDAAIIMGGLHHCVADLPATLRTVASMLKPGGHFFFFEPNKEYVLQSARRLWYRADKYFDADTEDGLAHADLVRLSEGRFEPQGLSYFGGPAFFLVYNSLVFRIPHALKAVISPPLMWLERLHRAVRLRWLHASFVAHWTKPGRV